MCRATWCLWQPPHCGAQNAPRQPAVVEHMVGKEGASNDPQALTPPSQPAALAAMQGTDELKQPHAHTSAARVGAILLLKGATTLEPDDALSISAPDQQTCDMTTCFKV